MKKELYESDETGSEDGIADITRGGKRKILIVEDNEINREILQLILARDYEIIQAENGEKGLEILRKQGRDISLVLLDIVMPVLDGYGFLDARKKDRAMSAVPVIVTTSQGNEADEIRCLEAGATDFVTKPYNARIVKMRVASIIRLRESVDMLHILRYDHLTGLYSKEFFYQYARGILDKHPDREYDLIYADVENFKLINERQGEKKGDEVLLYIADKCRDCMQGDEICARVGSNAFAVFVQHSPGFLDEKVAQVVKAGFPGAPISNLIIRFGIYECVDRSISISGMCDRAMIAMCRIKHQYGKYVSIYDDSLRLAMLREQKIIETMGTALRERQFQVYYQPKHDIYADRTAGAEALVRWVHPEMGFLSPGEFIPLFEKNGFIPELDYYVWDETCRTIAQWKEEGVPVVPVSVNISRADFENPHLAELIGELTEKYNLDRGLLHLEITETAYTENPQQLLDVVSRLRGMGFKIEMDDFGSGYSSLNMLSELPVDVLKLDMRFIQQKPHTEGRSVLNFVGNLAKYMNLNMVGEGVETLEQVEKLREIGCSLAQGYYYAKPMPKEQFKTYLTDGKMPN